MLSKTQLKEQAMRKYLFLLMITPIACAWFSQAKPADKVSAVVDIRVRSGDAVRRAKTHDTLKPGDRLNLYVIPKFDAQVYVVHSDGASVELLFATTPGKPLAKDSLLALPSAGLSYTFDGESRSETLTIICSPQPVSEITTFFTGKKQEVKTWATLENDLIGKSRIQLSEEAQKPFAIAGNVRSLIVNDSKNSLNLHAYSGNGHLVRKYTFHVQK